MVDVCVDWDDCIGWTEVATGTETVATAGGGVSGLGDPLVLTTPCPFTTLTSLTGSSAIFINSLLKLI